MSIKLSVVMKFVCALWIALLGSVSVAHAEDLKPFNEDDSGQLFRIAGSNTVGASLMKNLLLDYFQQKGLQQVQVVALEKENEYRVQGVLNRQLFYADVAAHGSSTGFKALLEKEVDFSMSSRAIKDKEVVALAHYGDMLSAKAENVIAIDGLAVIVNQMNPIVSLNIDDIAKIFAGEINNWKQLGGEDLPIHVYARDDRSGTWDTFKSLVLRKLYSLTDTAKRFESNDDLSDVVSQDRGGIGFVGLASVNHSRALSVNDEGTAPLLPQKTTVATEDYVLSRRLFLYTPPSLRSPIVSDFVHYVHTNAGQSQVEKTGFISQALMETEPEPDREGPADYLSLTRDAQRLSVNFRFAQGSARLDNKAQRDIGRIVDYMQLPEHAGKHLLLVGFGDTSQTESRAIILSKLRATAVKAELYRAGVSSLPVSGFGAFMPVAATNTTKGKIKNQRVEVWVK